MPENQMDAKKQIDELLSNAEDLTENKFTYANSVHVSISAHEVVMDLYFLSSDPKPNARKPQAQRIQRIVLPIDVAKEAAAILLGGVAQWEQNFGVTLPLSSQEGQTNE